MKAFRYVALACSAGAALALAGAGSGARAAYTSAKLIVGSPPALGAKGTTAIKVTLAPLDDPTAKVTFFAPKEFTADLTAAPGSNIGAVDAKVQAADLGGATLPLSGPVQARAADGTYLSAGAPVPIAAAATACTGTATHSAFWVLVLAAAGQTLEVPVFVDTTSGPEAQIGSTKIQVCLPPPDLPPGTPGRAAFGAKLFEATLALRNVFTNAGAPGLYPWIGIFTPYNPGVGTVNAAGTVLAAGIVPLPVVLTFKARFDKKKSAAILSGRLTAAGNPAPGQRVQILAGTSARTLKVVGSTRTTGTGTFSATRRVTRTTFFAVRITSGAVDVTAQFCAQLPPIAPAGCVSATVAGGSFQSTAIKVTVPKKK